MQTDTTSIPARQAPPISVKLSPDRTLDTIVYVNSSSGANTAFVFSRANAHSTDSTKLNDSSANLAFGKFDLMQGFNWDASDSMWKLSYMDSIHYGVDIRAQDITHDGKPELLLFTRWAYPFTAGTGGIIIYSCSTGSWKRIFSTTAGDPELQDIDNDSLTEIVLHGYFKGMLPEPLGVRYVSEIYAFDGAEFTRATARYPKYFSGMATAAKKQYSEIKTQTPVTSPISDETNFTLYKPCLQTLAWLRATGDTSSVLEFWNGERGYLERMIPQEQYVDLDVFAHMPIH